MNSGLVALYTSRYNQRRRQSNRGLSNSAPTPRTASELPITEKTEEEKPVPKSHDSNQLEMDLLLTPTSKIELVVRDDDEVIDFNFWMREAHQKGLAWLTTEKGKSFSCKVIGHIIERNYQLPPLITDPGEYHHDKIMLETARQILALNFRGVHSGIVMRRKKKRIITI